MDNREDEQLRGITMKSSAIALQFDEGWSIFGHMILSCMSCDFQVLINTSLI